MHGMSNTKNKKLKMVVVVVAADLVLVVV